MTVLIVDDDGDDRDLFCNALHDIKPDANCVVLSSGEEALKYLRGDSHDPDYIFFDIYMHTIDGKECLLKIKSLKDRMRIPVVMYSGVITDREKTIFKKLGASHFMVK